MASPTITSKLEDKFTEAENSINSVLDIPIRLLTVRKQTMLDEVALIRGEYDKIQSDNENSIQELKASKEELECIASLMKENQAQGELEKAVQNLDMRIKALELETPNPPNIDFTHSLSELEQIETLINSFGKVECEVSSAKLEQTASSGERFTQSEPKSVENIVKEGPPLKKTDPSLKPRDYSTIAKSPQTKIARFGKGENEFLDPDYMYVDEINGRIYISDCGNGRIQVWTINGEYLSEFGKKRLVSPVGIAICAGAIFITDFFKQMVFKFNHSNHSYVDKDRKFSYPHGIDSEGSEIFVAEPFKHRVSVLNLELRHKRMLGIGVIKKCYGIKVREGVLYALEYNTNTIKLLHSQSGELIRSVPTNKDGESMFNVTFLAMDFWGNFFLTDMVADQLKILSPEGETLANVHFKGWKSHEPKGVAVTPQKKLFIGFGEGENSVLIL